MPVSKKSFRVGTIVFSSISFLENCYNKFEITDTDIPDYFVNILGLTDVNYGIEKYMNDGHYETLFRFGGDVMLCDKSYSNALILPLHHPEHLNSFLCQMFYTHAVQKNYLQFHSSLISYNGNGLMFLGPSGIGKTTQAELWNQYRDALIINGDVVFVEERESLYYGWGTPWHGSSPYCENTNVPVKALIVLKQGDVNSIRELHGFEKVTAVSESVFYPKWLDGGMEMSLAILNRLLSTLPVYEFINKADEESVDLVERVVLG